MIFETISPEVIEAVRKDVNLDRPGRIDDAVNILQEWIAKQEHFTEKWFRKYLPEEYLERNLIMNKGLIERTKQKIEHICTYRTLMPEFFKPLRREEFFELLKSVNQIVLPKLTEDHYRVYMYRGFDNFDDRILDLFFRQAIMGFEYMCRFDYQCGLVIILDFRYISIMKLLSKISLTTVTQLFTIATEGYSFRIKSINLLSDSKTINALVNFFKQVLPAKLGARLRVLKTIDTLYELVPKEYFPKDYGGEEKPLKELNEIWIDTITTPEFVSYYNEMNQRRTNEKLRRSEHFHDNYVGTPGCFRLLSVD